MADTNKPVREIKEGDYVSIRDNSQDMRRLIKRRIIPNGMPYEVLKPLWHGDGFEQLGRKYNAKQIATLYHQNRLHPKFAFEFEPPQLQSEIEELVKKYMPERSEDEKAALGQQHEPRTN